MTVTIVCDVLGSANNGTTVAAENLIEYLKSRGHKVRVLCADGDKSGTEGYYVVPRRNFLCFNGYVEKNGVSLAKPDKAGVRSAVEGSDIVHVMLPFVLGICAAKTAVSLGIPVSAGFHLFAENFTAHLHLENSDLANRLTYIHFNKLYKLCNAVHYPTRLLRDVYESMFGVTNGYVISNGADGRFKPSGVTYRSDFYNVLYVGRYSKEKAHSTLIDAVRLCAHRDKIKLVLAGAGPLETELKKRAEKLPVPPVFGSYPRELMPEIYNGAYLYVHAAEIEAEGISCLEAMACGVPPVICDAPRCATQYYALTDMSLFKHGDARDLAAKIDWWIDRPDARNDYASKYADFAFVYLDKDDCMEQMENMFAETVERFSHGDRRKPQAVYACSERF